MQGHFCFIKCLIFEWLPEVDVSATCCIFDEACSCGPYLTAGAFLEDAGTYTSSMVGTHFVDEY